MKKTINNPLVSFRYLIENFHRYEKFFIKDIFNMLPSVMPEDPSGVTNRMEELRILFTTYRSEYKIFPEGLTLDLEEIFTRLQEEKILLELSIETLKEYFSIDLKKYDQNLLAKYSNDWFKFCYMVNRTRKTFSSSKEKISLEEKIQELQKGLSEALSVDDIQEVRFEGDLFDADAYEDNDTTLLSTGYRSVDVMLSPSGKSEDGGFVRGGLYVFMAGPKGGKSLVLSNFMVRAIKSGHNIAIASFEMPKADYFQRVNTNLYGISRSHYKPNTMKELVKDKNPKFGKAYFRQFTNAHTPSDVERWAAGLQSKHGFKLDMLFVDYINLLSDGRNSKSENTYLKIKSIAEDLRSSGMRNDWVTVSVTQTNRAAEGSPDYTLADVSESHALSATVDALMGIVKQPNIDNQRKLTLIASRRSGNQEPIFFNVDWTQWRLREIADFSGEDMGLNQDFNLTNLF